MGRLSSFYINFIICFKAWLAGCGTLLACSVSISPNCSIMKLELHPVCGPVLSLLSPKENIAAKPESLSLTLGTH